VSACLGGCFAKYLLRHGLGPGGSLKNGHASVMGVWARNAQGRAAGSLAECPGSHLATDAGGLGVMSQTCHVMASSMIDVSHACERKKSRMRLHIYIMEAFLFALK
jgi:hypothetical protein